MLRSEGNKENNRAKMERDEIIVNNMKNGNSRITKARENNKGNNG